MQALTTVAEISFDTLRKTITFPAGPLERDPHSSTPHLAYNAQNSVVYAYENGLSELLTKLDAVESREIQIGQRREEGVSRPNREGVRGAGDEGDSDARSGRSVEVSRSESAEALTNGALASSDRFNNQHYL